jgi:hypothetical protein
VRNFQTTPIRNGLSDPFKPSPQKSLEDSKKFYEEKLKGIKSSEGLKYTERSESLLTQLVKR